MSWPHGRGWAIMPAPAICWPAPGQWRRWEARFPGLKPNCASLPGLGAYTAAALAAIAFGRRAVVIDANVERVVARLFAIGEPLPAGRAAIRTFAETITPELRSGDFAQAMMDLGATICTTRNPRCLLCPLASDCSAYRAGEPEAYPVKPAKPSKPHRQGRVYWIERQGAVWLVRREGKGMLGGMRAFPDDGWTARSNGSAEPPLAGPWQAGGVVRHIFTHFSLELHLQLYSGGDWDSLVADEANGGRSSGSDEAGLPTLFAKAARLAVAGREEE